jgi:hypothetical protein
MVHVAVESLPGIMDLKMPLQGRVFREAAVNGGLKGPGLMLSVGSASGQCEEDKAE